MAEDLTLAESHFAFGKNWAAYAAKISEAEIAEAQNGLRRLVGEELPGRRLLDIGCGSGVHALSALRLGASSVLAVDLDTDSVATTRALLEQRAAGGPWEVRHESVFALSPETAGTFDVVYSWGVLHHTGDMVRAMTKAAAMVAPGGIFAFALYRRVWMDWFWRLEKRWYAKASPAAQRRAQAVHVALFKAGLTVTGRNAARYIAEYRGNRGMDFHHDVHDWMGGWPYESISDEEVEAMLVPWGFTRVRAFVRRGVIGGREVGIFGSGCDEYVYRRA